MCHCKVPEGGERSSFEASKTHLEKALSTIVFEGLRFAVSVSNLFVGGRNLQIFVRVATSAQDGAFGLGRVIAEVARF